MPATKTQLTGGLFQDSEGNVLANGYLKFTLNQDNSVTGVASICAGVTIQINLNASGSVDTGTPQYIWATDVMSTANSFYRVTGYTAQGQPAWGPNNQQVTSGGVGGGTFDVGTWIPNTVVSWTPSVQSLLVETNGIKNSTQATLNIAAGTNVTAVESGGTVTIAATGGPSLSTAGSGWLAPTSFIPFTAGSLNGVASTICSGATVANQVGAVQFILPYTITIRAIALYVVTGGGVGFSSAAIYDSTGTTKLVDAGANAFDTHTASQTLRIVTITPVTLSAGVYWLAMANTDGAATVLGYSVYQFAPPIANANVVRYGSAANSMSAGAMPASLGVVTGWGTVSSSAIPHLMFLV
jgi:hypothetical protein